VSVAIRAAGLPTALWLAVAPLSGCAHRPPEPAVAALPVVNPSAPVVEPHRATGSYLLTTDLERSRPATPAPRRRQRRPPPAQVPALRLDFQPLAAPDATASSSTQLAASVNIPGYTRAPPGRIGQAAAWWPLPGDSVIVHFATPRGDGLMDLRGMLKGDTLAGEVWYTSSSGTVFQLGTFRAVKQKR
jgi:hypothetical protein